MATSSGRSSTSRAPTTPGTSRRTTKNEGEEIGGVEAIEVVETGPLRGAVRVRRAWRDSRIEQTYRLLAGSRRLDIVTRIDWHERQVYLQARFPLAVHSHEATYETLYGVIRRPTHRNTSWDAARYEVSGHRFADLSEPGYGVALLNDAQVRLLRARQRADAESVARPALPRPRRGRRAPCLHLQSLPHPGDWTEGNVVNEAFALNSPLIAVPAAGDGFRGGDRSFPGDRRAAARAGQSQAGRRWGRAHSAPPRAARQSRAGDACASRAPCSESSGSICSKSRPRRPAPVLTDDGMTVHLDVRPFEVVSLRVVVAA